MEDIRAGKCLERQEEGSAEDCRRKVEKCRLEKETENMCERIERNTIGSRMTET